MIRIGFTGTQWGMSSKQLKDFRQHLEALIKEHGEVEFHHGGCIGADHEAAKEARYKECKINVHPPTNQSKVFNYSEHADVVHPQKLYLYRNKDIVDSSEIMFAAPKSNVEKIRSGTWATIRYARKRGIRLVLLER